MRELHYDVVIVGCGVGGLYTALNLPEDKQILMLSKAELETCDSMLAQAVSACCGTRMTMIRILRIRCVPVIMKTARKVSTS